MNHARQASLSLRILHPAIKTVVTVDTIEELEAELIHKHHLPFGTTALCNGERRLVEDGLITLKTPPGSAVMRLGDDESWSKLQTTYFTPANDRQISQLLRCLRVTVIRLTLYKGEQVQLEHEELLDLTICKLAEMLQKVRSPVFFSIIGPFAFLERQWETRGWR